MLDSLIAIGRSLNEIRASADIAAAISSDLNVALMKMGAVTAVMAC